MPVLMPEGLDLQYVQQQDWLTRHELRRLLQEVFIPLGFTRFRLTGGGTFDSFQYVVDHQVADIGPVFTLKTNDLAWDHQCFPAGQDGGRPLECWVKRHQHQSGFP